MNILYFWLFTISRADILKMVSWKMLDPKMAATLEFEPLTMIKQFLTYFILPVTLKNSYAVGSFVYPW